MWILGFNHDFAFQTSKSSVQASRPSGYGPSPSKPQDPSNVAGDKASDTTEKQQMHMPYDKNSAVCLIHDIHKLTQMLTLLYDQAIEPKVCFLPTDKVTAIKGKKCLWFVQWSLFTYV